MVSPAMYEFFNKSKVISGNCALEHIPIELDGYDAKKPLVITSKTVKARGLDKKFVRAFCESDVVLGAMYDGVSDYASIGMVAECAGLFRDRGCDSIIALGCGPVMDVAKGVNIAVSEKGEIIEYLNGKEISSHLKPFLAVPTAAVSGYEMSDMAVIDHRMIKSGFLYPDIVVVDQRMTVKNTVEDLINSSMVALAHAVEAAASPYNNPMIDAWSLGAVQYVAENLPRAIKKPGDRKSTLALVNAFALAAVAFSNAPAGMVHHLGIALEEVTGNPRGIFMGMLLPVYLSLKLSSKIDLRGELLLALAGFDVFSATPEKERGGKAVELIGRLVGDCGEKMPRTLSAMRIPEHSMKKAAERAVQLGGKSVQLKDCLAVLGRVWK
jgi:alcohol dehydrogenase